MKRPDPRVLRAEKLLTEALRLIAEVKAGVRAPRRRKRPRRYKLPAILAALREGASLDAPNGARDPRLPSRPTLAKYRKANPAFDGEAHQILRERRREASRRRRHGPTPGAATWGKRLPGRRYDWDEILRRIAAGAVIGPNSSNRQGLPSHTLIMARRKADPVFGAGVASILASRIGPRRYTFDREMVLELIRRGAVIAARPPEPGMPWREHLNREREGDPAFNAEVLAAIGEARRRRSQQRRQQSPVSPRRLPGPDIDWAAVAADIEAGAIIDRRAKDRRSLPSEKMINMRRQADPVFAARVAAALKGRRGARSDWGESDQDGILEKVRDGVRLDSRPAEPGMPSMNVIRRMRRDSPTFAVALDQAIAEGRRRRANVAALRKLGRNGVWALAQKAVPSGIDPDLRDDIIGELSLLLLTGIVGVRDDLTSAWKRCRTRLNSDRWKETSLDAPISGTDGLRRIDLLAEDAERF